MENTNLEYTRLTLHTRLLTLYTKSRLPTLGAIHLADKKYIWEPTAWGKAAEVVLKSIQRSPKIVSIQEYVVMPNHIHLIVSYRHHTPHILDWFTANCKQMMNAYILHIKHTSYPVWEYAFHSIEIRHDCTLSMLCENLRTHHSRWQYDSLRQDAQAALRQEKERIQLQKKSAKKPKRNT